MCMLVYLRLDMGYPICVLVYPHVIHDVYNINGDLSLSYTLVMHEISPCILRCNMYGGLSLGYTLAVHEISPCILGCF
jgi:hypothetical protein